MREREAERLRAEAKLATRRALLRAGLTEMLNSGGLKTPSIEAICSRAGYTRGAFYVHFDNREHFVAELLEWVLTDIIEVLFADTADEGMSLREILARFHGNLATKRWPDVDQNIRAAYLGVMRSVQRGSRVRDRHAHFMREIIARVAQSVRDGQSRGELRPDVDPDELATLIVLMSVGMIMWDDIGVGVDGPVLGEALLDLVEMPAIEITQPSEADRSRRTNP